MPDDNMMTNQPIPTVPPMDSAMPVDTAIPADAATPVNPAAIATPPMTSDSIPAMPDASPAVPSIPFQDATVDTTPIIPADNEIYPEIASKISDAHNVLIALSSDPSVDEMAAAIGLSLYLDKLGKRATAIYSGATPNALEFLKPEETFEPSADTLQDFVIALNKDKADHLRYKLDGDYVKVYITPYRTKITEGDLDFSYGDYNVDLVLALNVANGIDLDSALREHGRIMHDAVIINITTGNPGKFGEIEWSDKKSSSVSEMIAKLLYSVKSEVEISKEEATAFLTGIVAATNRFSNASTTPETMTTASKLMRSGANQQLISKNITPDVDNQLYSLLGNNVKSNGDPTKLDIEHEEDRITNTPIDESKEVNATVTEKESTLLDDLKAAEASLASAAAETVPDISNQPVRLDSPSDSTQEPAAPELPPVSEELPPVPEPAMPEPTTPESVEPAPAPEPIAPELPPVPEPTIEEPISSEAAEKGEKVIAPPADMDLNAPDEGSDKYGKMLEDALAGIDTSAPEPVAAPATSEPASTDANPAAMNAPTVASNPEINGVPEMNYMPLPGDEILPPPPTPPIDMNTSAEPTASEPIAPIEPAAPAPAESVNPTPEPTPTSLGPQPAMQDQVYVPQASDPSAFKIPGM